MYVEATMPEAKDMVVVVPGTQQRIEYVRAANTEEGWLEAYVKNADGHFEIEPGKGLRCERRYQDYDLIKKSTSEVLAQARKAA